MSRMRLDYSTRVKEVDLPFSYSSFFFIPWIYSIIIRFFFYYCLSSCTARLR